MSAPFTIGFYNASDSTSGFVSTASGVTPPSQGPQFRNYNEVKQALATRPILYDYHPPDEDVTFPANQPARDNYLRQLYDSFIDTSSCIDCENTAAFVNRWQGIATYSSQYTPTDIETCCHALLEIAIKLHTRGPRSLMVFDDGKLEQMYKHRKLKFAQRIDSVCELLRLSKARCQALMRFDGLEMAVATAPLMAKQAKMNSTLNRKRQSVISKARALRDGEEVEECDDESEGEEEVEE